MPRGFVLDRGLWLGIPEALGKTLVLFSTCFTGLSNKEASFYRENRLPLLLALPVYRSNVISGRRYSGIWVVPVDILNNGYTSAFRQQAASPGAQLKFSVISPNLIFTVLGVDTCSVDNGRIEMCPLRKF